MNTSMQPVVNFKMFVLALLSLLGCCTAQLDPATEQLPHSMTVDADEKFTVLWDFNQTHITFELRVKTLGYVGIGVSPNGGMPGSIIVTGWVDDETGKTHLTDRLAEGRFEPRPTEQQDSVLLSASQNETHTVVRFTRPLVVCGLGASQIRTDTVRLIWAYNDRDPPTELGLRYHGPNRGTRSVFLLNPLKTKPELSSESVTYDFLNNQVEIPDDPTFYWCQSFMVPELDRKHHIIKFEPLLDRVAETHHMILYFCVHKVMNSSINVGRRCYTANMPADFWSCRNIMAGWAVGGGDTYLPEHVGSPIGFEGGPSMFMMETHYDNPRRLRGLRDSSGFRLTLTPKLRRYDAGVIDVGVAVSSNVVIPAFADRFLVEGHCTKECLEQGMEGHVDEVKVFGAMLHTHLAGRALRLRHFRYGIEQEPIALDNNYDFNLQEIRLLEREIILRKGDNLVTECYYGTQRRTNITRGGFSTREEMCIAYVLYYPRIPLSECSSLPTLDRLFDFLDIKVDLFNRVVSPERLRGRKWDEVLESEVDWTDPAERLRFQQWVNERGVETAIASCNDAGQRHELNGRRISYPQALWERPEMPSEFCPFVSRANHETIASLMSVLVALCVLIM